MLQWGVSWQDGIGNPCLGGRKSTAKKKWRFCVKFVWSAEIVRHNIPWKRKILILTVAGRIQPTSIHLKDPVTHLLGGLCS